jgi:hypothetical protein
MAKDNENLKQDEGNKTEEPIDGATDELSSEDLDSVAGGAKSKKTKFP